MPAPTWSPASLAISRLPRFAAIASTLMLVAAAAADGGQELLIPVKGEGGKASPLFQQVVVTSDEVTLCETGPGCDKGVYVEPYSIFYKLRTPAGAEEENGWVRVGTATGTPIGWIKRTDSKGQPALKEWATRFVLRPNVPTADRKFTVNTTTRGPIELIRVPDGRAQYAFITGSSDARGGDDTEYDVFVCTCQVQKERGALDKERRRLENLKLEVVFVIEASDFMLNKLGSMVVGDAVKQVVAACIDQIKADEQLKDAVRLGIVEYQDTSPNAQFRTPRVTCKLTADMDTVRSSLGSLAPAVIGGDFPEDVIGGLRVAIDDAGWEPLSCKHVVLLGFASAQLYPQGKSPGNFPGQDNELTRALPPLEERGWNSTGLSIQQLIDRANPGGGSDDDKARAQKTFHTIRISKSIREEQVQQILAKEPNLGRQRIREIVDFAAGRVGAVISASNADYDATLERIGAEFEKFCGDELNVGPVIRVGAKVVAFETDELLAKSQYQTIAANEGLQGLLEFVPPEETELRRVATTLKSSLAQALETLSKIRSGVIHRQEDLPADQRGITGAFYALVGGQQKDPPEPVLDGRARTKSDDAREVAKRKVMVGRKELNDLKVDFAKIYARFETRVAKKDRQNVNDVLDQLKQAVAGAAAGQIVATTKLQDVITDLPLSTDVLRITPEQIAALPSDRFKAWLDGLKRSIDRAQTLLDSNADWTPLSKLGSADEVTFLTLTELP